MGLASVAAPQGNCLKDMGLLREAVEQYQLATARAPEDPTFVFNLAQVSILPPPKHNYQPKGPTAVEGNGGFGTSPTLVGDWQGSGGVGTSPALVGATRCIRG